MAETQAQTQTMQCMEVWGGNQPFDGGVTMVGLDAWIHSRPFGGSATGGDIHYVSSCATGRITRLLVADVSGHGAAVSETAATLRTLMRRFVNYIDQTRFVEAMNQQFAVLSAANVFATALVTTFFAPTGHLSVSNAGHPPALMYTARLRKWMILTSQTVTASSDNIPLGIIDAASYDQFDVRLAVGDVVMCYTDSLIEARDRSGRMLSTRGLLDVVSTIDPGEPTVFITALLDAVGESDATNLTDDDVTILLFRSNGVVPSVPMKDRLAAPFRVARGVIGWLAGRGPAPWPEWSLANIGGSMISSLSRGWRGAGVRRRQSG